MINNINNKINNNKHNEYTEDNNFMLSKLIANVLIEENTNIINSSINEIKLN